MSGHRRNIKGKKPLTHGWIVVPSKTYPDRVYFYNTVTKCSTWNNPCEVINDEDYSNTSSDASSPKRKRPLITHCESPMPSNPRKQKIKSTLYSPDKNFNIKLNNDIEDYDEQQDQYFDNAPINAFILSRSNIISPSSSPISATSFRTNNISDSDKHSECSETHENNEKQLWVHFALNPEKPNAKKSLALSDINEPSTSKKLEIELSKRPDRSSSLLKSTSQDYEERLFDTRIFDEITKKNTNSSKRKKSKKKKKEDRDKNVFGKINVSLKTRDKTPAQTRLLKLKRQNAEKIKKLSKFSYVIPNNDVNSNSRKVEPCDSFSDAYIKKIEMFNTEAQEVGNHSKDDDGEVMDWEPSSEEFDVRNINVFRKQLDRANEVSGDIFFGLNSDHSTAVPFKSHICFLILDTNIFVSCLTFVKDIRDTKLPDLGYPVIYVPWRVLQELDHLKDTKIDTVNKHLHVNVRKAIAYLNENFKSKHPRVYGQSFEEFSTMVEMSAPDDEILQTCIQFQKKHQNKKLMLLTNDKNLESKAIVSGVEVYSKERFQKKFLTSNVVSTTGNISSSLDVSHGSGEKTDGCLCEVKAILKEFLSSVVETEMKIVFEGDWTKLVYKKPPWTLQDAFQCLLKHWRSVFFLNFSKETHTQSERLFEKLFKRGPVTSEDVVDVIKVTQRLVLSIKRSQTEKRPYLDLIPSVMTKLSNLLIILSPNHMSEAESGESTALFSSLTSASDSTFPVQQTSKLDVPSNHIFKVKNLFKDIWDSLRSFCCSISDVLHSSSASNEVIVQEIRLKLGHILNDVGELVVVVEKILETSVTEISDRHPLINHFSNFLIRFYPVMAADLKGELPQCLEAFFSDFEGRSLLTSSLNDFKEFIQDLTKATQYFNTNFTY